MNRKWLIALWAAVIMLTGCASEGAESRFAEDVWKRNESSAAETSSAESVKDSRTESEAEALTKESVPMTRSMEYFYDLMTDERIRQGTLRTLAGLREHSEKVDLEGLEISEEEYGDIFDVIVSCEPELGWMDYKYEVDVDRDNEGCVLNAYFRYKLTKEEEMAAVKKLRAEVSEAAEEAAGLGDFEKMLYFHDRIVAGCDYSNELDNAWSAYGCLVDGKAVCEGYSKALIALCEEAGMLCIPVNGCSDKEGHALHMWNKVMMDGEWYNMDLTWDDPTAENDSPVSEEDAGTEYIHRDYFGLTDEETEKDHSFIETTVMRYPAAEAEENNYFIRTGAFIEKEEEAKDIIYTLAVQALEDGETVFQFRCADSEVYSTVNETEFSENGEIFFVLYQINDEGYPIDPGRYNFTQDEEHCIFTVIMKWSCGRRNAAEPNSVQKTG